MDCWEGSKMCLEAGPVTEEELQIGMMFAECMAELGYKYIPHYPFLIGVVLQLQVSRFSTNSQALAKFRFNNNLKIWIFFEE